MRFPVSAFLTSLPLDFVSAVREIAALGFTHVDVVGLAVRPEEHLESLADSGLLVSCASLGRDLPGSLSLDALALDARRQAVGIVQRQIADTARLGATCGYLVPGIDASSAALARFADACRVLGDFAGQRQMQLCVEHCPGKALPSVAAALDWLSETDRQDMKLLVDVGHCLISGEEPAQAIQQAGERLGYVHLDDNDGVKDLHRPLLAGRLTEQMLTAALTALRAVGYQGALALELNPHNADPIGALRDGKSLVERCLVDLAHVPGTMKALNGT